jgi:Ca2+-binding RTX toxin-like protein
MNSTSLRVTGRRFALGLSAVAVVLGSALVSSPGQAAVLVVVPPGCGSLSGTLVSSARLDDHSGDAVALGSQGAPYVANAVFDMITVGTPFGDFINGTNGVNDTICGLGGDDTITGANGNDDIFGGAGEDDLSGNAGADLLSGGPQNDDLYGDDIVNSAGGVDGGDTLQGGDGNDKMKGGAGFDTIAGGSGPDKADGEANLASCTSAVTQVNC